MMKKSLRTIIELYEKYRNDKEIQNKITDRICNLLPIEIVGWCKELERQNLYNDKINTYIDEFMDKIQYFYILRTDIYIRYDGRDYTQISEDELLYTILSSITERKILLNRKQEIKDIIISRIRDNPIKNGIPESITIQNIINYFYPVLFKTKSEAKYFLTILGDNILRKESYVKHILNYNAKKLVQHILFCNKDYFNNEHIASSFDVETPCKDCYDDYRLIDFKESIDNHVYWKFFVEQNILNIASVAIHYSQRYVNSESYLNENIEYKNNILFFKNHNQTQIVEMFCKDYLSDLSGGVMQDNEIKYLWKKFTGYKNIPEIFENGTRLKSILNKLCKSNKINIKDGIIFGKTHENLFVMRGFLKFWENKIVIDKNDEIEISEVFYFFKKYSGIKTSNERELLKIMEYCFSYIKITNKQTIYGYRCLDWDKHTSIKDIVGPIVAVNSLGIGKVELYKRYCKKVKKDRMAVSKTYFMANIDSILSEI